MIKRIVYTFFMLIPIGFTFGQQIPDVKFNHLSFTLAYEDLLALRESSFVVDTLGVFETRTTHIDSSSTFTKCFIYGQSNYLELFETAPDDPVLGFLTIVLSVDEIDGLQKLRKGLHKSYQTGIRTYNRDYDEQEVPWYESLAVIDTSVVDSVFMTQMRFWFWIMGYKTEYFDYHGFTITNDELTRENYLEEYSTARDNRMIRDFTGIGIKLSKDEKRYLTKFFESIAYKKRNENEYVTCDGFRFLINERPPGDQSALEFIEFETSKVLAGRKNVRISNGISISIQGNKGHFFFD